MAEMRTCGHCGASFLPGLDHHSPNCAMCCRYEQRVDACRLRNSAELRDAEAAFAARKGARRGLSYGPDESLLLPSTGSQGVLEGIEHSGPSCSNCGRRRVDDRHCESCRDLYARMMSLKGDLRRFDTARISTLKSRLLSRRFGQGAADAARLALGAALTALTGAGALGMMGAKEAGLGEKSYAAKDILGEADAQYLADYLSLAAKLERKSGEFSARNRAYVAELERAAALLADEKQRRALEAERQRELDRARRLLGRSDGGTD